MIVPPELSSAYAELDSNLSDPFTKSILTHCLKTFSIYSPEIKAELSQYFLLHWDTSHFLSKLEGMDKSIITRNEITYYVIYMGSIHPTDLIEFDRVRVSFRKPKCLSFGFVLVKPIKPLTLNTKE